MTRALFPFHCYMTPAAARMIGPHLSTVAVKALRAVLHNGRGFEIAHQQITWDEHDLAFSTRFNASGDLVLEFDEGAEGLRDRVILEQELRREIRAIRGVSPPVRRSRKN